MVSSVNDQVEWLRAQLDVDEQAALAVREEYRSWWQDGLYPETGPRKVVSTYGHLMAQPPADIAAEITGHIGRHDPARVLREVEAKRRILDLYAEAQQRAKTESWRRDQGMGSPTDLAAAAARAAALAQVVRLHAAALSDRPGYREEWQLAASDPS